MNDTSRLFHIVDRDVWAAAVRAGEYRPPSLETEGFVHFSFAHQVRTTWRAFYGQLPNLFVVEATGLPVVIENGFPHVYKAIPASAAVATYDLDDPMFTEADRGAADR